MPGRSSATATEPKRTADNTRAAGRIVRLRKGHLQDARIIRPRDATETRAGKHGELFSRSSFRTEVQKGHFGVRTRESSGRSMEARDRPRGPEDGPTLPRR